MIFPHLNYYKNGAVTMKELNVNETQQISGGVDLLVLGIGGLAIANFLYTLSQNTKIDKLNEFVLFSATLTLYHEVQLSLLPYYDTVSNYTLDELF